MAKGLRSKWKRSRKADRRERYGKKEMARLLKVIDGRKVTEADVKENAKNIFKENMKDIATVVDHPVSEMRDVNEIVAETEGMAVDAASKEFSTNSLQNEHGNYPKWMHKRKINGMKKTRKNPTTFKFRKRKKVAT